MNDDADLLLAEEPSPKQLLPGVGWSKTGTSLRRSFAEVDVSGAGLAVVPSPPPDVAPGQGHVPASDTAPPNPRPSRRRPTVPRVITVVLTLALGLGWLVAFRPLGLGGPASYVVVSGRSMEPTYRTGDLVITRAASIYDLGDIVAFRTPEDGSGRRPVVIHRIVGGDASGYVLQGDNKEDPDLWRPRPEDILGRAWLTLPGGGFVLAAARSPLALAALAGVFVFLATVAPSAGDLRRDRSRRGRWATGRKALQLAVPPPPRRP